MKKERKGKERKAVRKKRGRKKKRKKERRVVKKKQRKKKGKERFWPKCTRLINQYGVPVFLASNQSNLLLPSFFCQRGHLNPGKSFNSNLTGNGSRHHRPNCLGTLEKMEETELLFFSIADNVITF